MFFPETGGYESTETDQEPIAFRIREGVAEPVRFATPKGASASAMGLAMAGKAAMAPASPQPFDAEWIGRAARADEARGRGRGGRRRGASRNP